MKKETKYTDPPRYELIKKYEGIAEDKFAAMLKITVGEIGKILTEK